MGIITDYIILLLLFDAKPTFPAAGRFIFKNILLTPLGLYIIIPKFIFSGNRLQAVSPTRVAPIYIIYYRESTRYRLGWCTHLTPTTIQSIDIWTIDLLRDRPKKKRVFHQPPNKSYRNAINKKIFYSVRSTQSARRITRFWFRTNGFRVRTAICITTTNKWNIICLFKKSSSSGRRFSNYSCQRFNWILFCFFQHKIQMMRMYTPWDGYSDNRNVSAALQSVSSLKIHII